MLQTATLSLSPSLVHHSSEAAKDFACNLSVLMCFFRESCLSFRIFYLNHPLAILLLTCLMPQLRQTRSNRIRNITMKEITTKTRWKKNYVQTTKNCLFLFFILIMCIPYTICCMLCMTWDDLIAIQRWALYETICFLSLSLSSSLLFLSFFTWNSMQRSAFSLQHSIEPAFK